VNDIGLDAGANPVARQRLPATRNFAARAGGSGLCYRCVLIDRAIALEETPMRMVRWLTALALLGAALPGSGARAAEALSTAERVALQASMSQYIDQHTIGDAFIHVDPKTGEVQKLYPATQHPMIVRLNEIVVLCADLRTKDGQLVNADFYATRDGGQFVIFQSEIGNRAPLQALMMKGVASLLE
jgi:hypothetical protein